MTAPNPGRKRRNWTFEPPSDAELDPTSEADWTVRLRGRWMFLDAVLKSTEALDDAPRPSDLKNLCQGCEHGIRTFGHYFCRECRIKRGIP